MKSFAIIGLGRFGSAIATTLYDLGYEVLAVDRNEERVQAIAGKVTDAATADVVEEGALKALGIRNFDVAIVAIATDMQASILTTVLLHDNGVKYVVARAQSDLHAKILEKVGADKVIFPERDMAVRVAYNLTVANALDYFELSPNISMVELTVPPDWVGKTLVQLDLRTKYGINVIASKLPLEADMNIALSVDEPLRRDEVLVVVGSKRAINAINKKK